MARAARTHARATLPQPTLVSAPLLTRPRDVVQGLRLHVSGRELTVRLGERIRWHRDRADALIEQMKKLSDVERAATDELAKALTRYDSPRTLIEKQLREHQERASFLAFLRDHITPDDVYRLDVTDLRMTEILPDRPW